MLGKHVYLPHGKKLVGIIGHLDVVPSGDGWNSNPFRAKIENGKIYGRGSIDDKGPVIAALYAMKAVKGNLKINSRVRLILGLNEEKSWECISHYKKVEEWPTIGFSPDADFPCIYAEKGIETIYLKENYTKYSNSPIQIYNIDCNNNATNSNLEPIAIGGGTYARAFDNCISFGMNFPGDIDMCHQANEFVYIDKLILACKIYAKAIYELAK